MGKWFLIAVVAAFLAGCGGGASSSLPPSLPASASTSAVLSTSSSTTVTLPRISNNISGSVALPVSSGAATLTLTYDSHVPSSVALPQANLRGAESIGGSGLTTLGVLAFSVSSTVAITTTPAFSFTTPSAVTGSAYIAFFDENNTANGWNVLQGPGTVNGTTISFPAQTNLTPLTFVVGDTYLFALVTSATTAGSATTAAFSGTKTVNFSYGYAFGFPSPAPGATVPPTTLTSAVTTAVSVGTKPFPGPSVAGLIDEHIAETDTQSLQTTTFATDEWAGATVSGGIDGVSLYGLVQQEPSSADLPVFTTIYGTPQLLDEYPETSGATWTNGPASTVAFSFADGSAGTRTVNADGTYLDTENLLATPSQPVTMTENSDGSGSITGPFFSGVLVGSTFGNVISSVTFSAPSGGVVTIDLNFTPFAQANLGDPASSSNTDPVWFPPPPVFYAESDKVTSGVALPAGCATAFGTSGTQVQRSITTLDTIAGDVETTTLDSYEIGGIPVCLASTDIVNFAYDEQNNQPDLILLGTLGLEVVTTTEVLSLQPGAIGALPAAKSRTAQSVAAQNVEIRAATAALEDHVLTTFVKARLVREHTFLTTKRSLDAASLNVIHGGNR